MIQVTRQRILMIYFLKQNQQYSEKRPANILVAQKYEHFKETFGNVEFLEQSYLWDVDQDKETILQEQIIQDAQLRFTFDKKQIKNKEEDNNPNSSFGDEKKDKNENQNHRQSTRRSLAQKEQHARQQDPSAILSNFAYFNNTIETKIDFVIQKSKSKQKINPHSSSNIIGTISRFLTNYTTNNLSSIESRDQSLVKQNKSIQQPGKNQYNWDEISASSACGDSIILGFGNGVVITLKTDDDQSLTEMITHVDYNFGGINIINPNENTNQIDKLKIVYIDSIQQNSNNTGIQQIYNKQLQSLLLTLTGGVIKVNTYPDFQQFESLNFNDQIIIDFEPYKDTKKQCLNSQISKLNYYFLAVLFQSKVLKIFQFDRSAKAYKYKTKISLLQNSNNMHYPIFDGGISVYKDVFIILYKNSAEYIKIENKGNDNFETVTRFQLWNFESIIENSDENELKESEDGSQTGGSYLIKQLNLKQQQLAQQGKEILKNKISKIKGDNCYPTPVFDDFLQVFIITRGDNSFYLDLNGNFDYNFRKIQWGGKVLKIEIASPYIIGYLAESSIEVRNIFNPNRIYQKFELGTCQYVTTCVAQNLQKKHDGRLDDFYIIIKNLDQQQFQQSYIRDKKSSIYNPDLIHTEKFTLIKFKQEKAEQQLSLWYELKLYSTSLKFIDYLQDYNLKGGVPAELYNRILRQKAFYNFIVKKRFHVAKDIVNRYLVPLPQIISLFQFMYPEGYYQQLESSFGKLLQEIQSQKQIKRIKIYQYLVKTQIKLFQSKIIQTDQDKPKQQQQQKKTEQNKSYEPPITIREDQTIIKDLRLKINFTSNQTIMEFINRNKPGKDPHYTNPITEPPASLLSLDELESIRQFLPFFQRENKGQYDQEPAKSQKELDEIKIQDMYYDKFTKEEILLILQFTEMLIFHFFIILISTENLQHDELYEQDDIQLYKNEFELLISADFSVEKYHEEFLKDFYKSQIQQSKRNENDQLQQQSNQSEMQIEEVEQVEQVVDKQMYFDPKSKRIRVKSQLPSFFCLDIFFKYRLFDEACKYLFYRREFNELFQMIRWEYEENQKQADGLKSQINRLNAQKKQNEDQEIQGQSLQQQQTQNSLGIKQQLENLNRQREQTRNLREYWFNKHIEQIQKLNDISPYDKEQLIDKVVDYCSQKSEWILKVNETKWVDCFKKSSNIEEIKNNVEDERAFQCSKPPLMNDKLLKGVLEKGTTKCRLRYLEYLTVKCKLQDTRLHTELGCLYVQYIKKYLKNFQIQEASQISSNGQDKHQLNKEQSSESSNINLNQEKEQIIQFDFEAAKINDKMIDCRNQLRTFLRESNLYFPYSVIEQLKPIKNFLNKENAILQMRIGQFKLCFDICVTDINDIQFALSVAKKGFEWHQKDRRIYYNLFTRLLETKDPENKRLAIQILSKHCQHIPFDKISKNFQEEDDFDFDLNTLYSKMFEQMDSNQKESIILKNLTELEKKNVIYQKFEFMRQFIEVNEDPERGLGITLCNYCSKPIGLSGFQYDPQNQTIIHTFHLLNQ